MAMHESSVSFCYKDRLSVLLSIEIDLFGM